MSEVNLLGLDDFGQNPGLGELYGLLIGGGVAVAGIGVASHFIADPVWQQRAGLIGLGAGAVASLAMVASSKTRAAGWAGLATAALVAIPSALLMKKSGTGTGGWGTPVIDQLGLPMVNQINGLGLPMVNQINGLDLPTALPAPSSYGTVPGVAGLAQPTNQGPPINLLGPGSARQTQAQMIAGPTLQAPHGLATSYGANLFS